MALAALNHAVLSKRCGCLRKADIAVVLLTCNIIRVPARFGADSSVALQLTAEADWQEGR